MLVASVYEFGVGNSIPYLSVPHNWYGGKSIGERTLTWGSNGGGIFIYLSFIFKSPITGIGAKESGRRAK